MVSNPANVEVFESHSGAETMPVEDQSSVEIKHVQANHFE